MASTSTSLPLHQEIRNEPQEALRIPIELQAVFLTSQQGHHQLCRAPPNKLAATTFRSARSAANGYLHDRSAKSGESVSTESVTGSCSSISSGGGNLCRQAERGNQNVPSASRKRNASNPTVCLTTSPPRARRNVSLQLSPQIYLDALIRSRGYCTERFKSLETAYSNTPTPLQQASYHVNLIGLVRQRDVSSFRRILGSGISPNPCNQFGESLLHTVCRRGDVDCLKAMLDAGATLNVCDDRGRTPLHDACWVPTPCFDVVDMILERDPRLLYVVDCRGASPFQYIPKPQWPEWLKFLEARKDAYWPPRNLKLEGAQGPPPLALLPPNSCPVPDPLHSLSVDLARQVSAGQLAVLKDEPSQHAGAGNGAGSTMDEMIGSSLSIITHRHAVPLHPLLRQAMAGNAATRTVEALVQGGTGVGTAEEASMMMVDDDLDGLGATSANPNTNVPTARFADECPDKVSSSSSTSSSAVDRDDHEDDVDDEENNSLSSDSLDSSDDDSSSSSSTDDDDDDDELLDEVIRISQQRRPKCHPMQ